MSSTTAAEGAPPLHGRSALVTGASRGIGSACATALHAAGARVVLVARDLDAMTALGKTLGSRVQAMGCDLEDPRSVRRTLSAAREALGGAPDILVNNAGRFTLAPVGDTSLEEFERTIQVNLVSQFAFVREFVGDMRARRSGHLVTIGSIADHRALPENAAYAASKFGARGLHEVLREELRGSGVRTTLVSPGPVDTTLWDAVDPDTRAGFTPRSAMLSADAVGDVVCFAVTRPAEVNVDELRVSRA